MEAENMRNSSSYKSNCTEEMTAAIKAVEISVTKAALPQSLSTAASLPGTIGRLSPEGEIGKTRKKRSRASRRSHTMVLNTDRDNFKATVQQFTGMTSANIGSACGFSPISESFEEYFLPKSMPADHQQYSSARLDSLDINNPPFAFYAYRPQPLFPFADKSSVGMMPSFFNNKAPISNNSQRQGMGDLSSANLWEELLGMDLPTSGIYTNM